MGWILPVLIAGAVGAIVKWLWDRKALFSTWKKLGINGPKPSSILLGNMLDISTHGRFHMNKEWTRKYGKVYGYYEGSIPTLCIADPDMVKEILIKQFHNFQQRMVFLDTSDEPHANVVALHGESWKRIRAITSPTFTGRKMKLMSPLIHQSIDKLMKKLSDRHQKNEDFDIYEDLKYLTLDVIASTAFSFETDVFNNSDNIFLKKLNEFFDTLDQTKLTFFQKLSFLIFFSFPSILPLAKKFNPRIVSLKNQWFLDLSKKMIMERQSSKETRDDYMQVMLNTDRGSAGNISDTDSDLSDNEETKKSTQSTSKTMTMEEMQGQIFAFLAAGYDTTSSTLGFICYYLALYPDIQAIIQNEIDEHFPTQGENINYETVQKLSYLDMVFCEVSRLASVGQIAVQRMCRETTMVGQIEIQKGTKVVINMPDIHMNPELWGPEPTEEFVPERFLPERRQTRHPMAYLPFGGGPKSCLAMRFAIMEAKMTLVNIMQKYTIVKCDKTKVPLETNKDGVHSPAGGVYVRLNERQQ